MATPAGKVMHRVKFHQSGGDLVLMVMLDPATVRRSAVPTASGGVARQSILDSVKKSFAREHGNKAPIVQFAHLKIEVCEKSCA